MHSVKPKSSFAADALGKGVCLLHMACNALLPVQSDLAPAAFTEKWLKVKPQHLKTTL